MKAVRFNGTIPRYLLGKTLGKAAPSTLWGGASCTYLADLPEETLPGPEWVRVRTGYGGICGSDLGAITLSSSLYFVSFTSFPFTLGHENAGALVELGPNVKGWRTGERVIVEPILWCRPRGFGDLCPFCERGEINLCQRTGDGQLAAGVLIGNCRDTGGSWGETFVAHESQLYRVPPSVSDENALMVEPFSCALHAALSAPPDDNETVLIVGAGTIGLCLVAALRAIGSRARILVLARYQYQADSALRLGASEVVTSVQDQDYRSTLAQKTGAREVKPFIGKNVYIGGADLTFECVGSDQALDDAMRLTRTGGRVILVGAPGITKGVDWAVIFANELKVSSAFTYNHAEAFAGRQWTTFGLSLDLMVRGMVDLGWMITHRFQVDDYRSALKTLSERSRNQVIKAVFDFR
ncbi:MAG: zinc-binding dehydrogenase [Chloroflexota bacterium]|nr:zinc-binding dehydrogenase [Chloroflexota bacterium]